MILPLLIAASILILLLTFLVPRVYRWCRGLFSRNKYDLLVDEDAEDAEADGEPLPDAMPSNGLVSDFKAHIRSLQEYGSVLFFMEVLRTLCIGALVGLSIYAAIQAEPVKSKSSIGDELDILKKHKNKKHKHKSHHDKLILGEYTPLELGEFGASAFYVSPWIRASLMAGIHFDLVFPAPHAQASYAGSSSTHRPSRRTAHPRLGTLCLSGSLPARDDLPLTNRPQHLGDLDTSGALDSCCGCDSSSTTQDVHACRSGPSLGTG